MAKENIRGTAPITQNEENVKRFFEEIFGKAEAQSSPFVNPKSAKTFKLHSQKGKHFNPIATANFRRKKKISQRHCKEE